MKAKREDSFTGKSCTVCLYHELMVYLRQCICAGSVQLNMEIEADVLIQSSPGRLSQTPLITRTMKKKVVNRTRANFI